MKKTMLVMLKTMGDVILATTLAHELKRDFPGHEITLYTNRPYDSLLIGNPDIAEVKAVDQWHINSIFLEMGSGKYDMVFAPYQARPECNAWHQFEETRHQHLLDFYWARMGMHRKITDRECYLFPSWDDTEKSREFISMDVPRVAIHSTTGVPSKDWPYFNELVEELRKAGYGCIQVGASSDRKVKGAVDLRGKMSFLELAAFLKRCAAFVGLDSGISYMSDAMRTPTLVIQGSTNPVTSGPISDRVIHLYAKETGYPDCQEIRCHANCRHEVNCNTKITVDMVLDKLEPILDGWKKPIPAGV